MGAHAGYARSGAPRRSAKGGGQVLSRDELDRRLLALLQADARASAADLARRLGVARTTVLSRLARLQREGVIVGFTVRLASDDGARGVEAYVGITTSPKSGRDVTLRLAALPELRQLCSVSGEFDYLALIRAENTTRLDALLDEIGGIDGVTRTTTAVVLARRIDRTA
jgi:DNA-binding Lrp family transcriptional regulator